MKIVTALRSWYRQQKPIPRVFIKLFLFVLSALLLVALIVLSPILVSKPWFVLPGLFTKEVEVEIGDGWINVEPVTVRRPNKIVFQVTNVGNEDHMFLVLVTDLTAENLPIENGQVPVSPYSDEPYDFLWYYDQFGHTVSYGRSARGSPRSPAEGPIIEPGENEEFEHYWGYDRYPSGLTLILLCNCPGHYERGEYATLTIK